jgi:sugar phosphate isomerase/epimerase
MVEPERYARLGSRLAIENMDARKAVGTTADHLEPFFEACPEALFCFDVAHAWSVDPDMGEAERLLDRYAWRLRHVHVSSLDEDGHHRPLDDEQESLFRPLLMRCRDVPWILEAPLR